MEQFYEKILTMDNVSDRISSLPRRQVFNFALILLALAGLGIIYLSNMIKFNNLTKEIALTKTLWKMTSPKMKTLIELEQNIGWWKLVLAGLMVGSLMITMTVRVFGPLFAISISSVSFLAWIIFLNIYWYFVILPARNSDSKREATGEVTETKAEKKPLWEKRERNSLSKSDQRLPVTIVTGFLGSGKTTLVKKILTNTIGLKILVIENEIGTEGIDHQLLMKHTGKEDIILMNNGCICCTVRNDLLSVFRRMFEHEAFAQLDWIVIETTGLADPAPLIHSFYMDRECQSKLRLDSVIAVADSKHLPLHILKSNLETTKSKGVHGGVPEAIQQLAYADRVILNKIDLVSDEEIQDLLGFISEINPSAKTILSKFGEVPLVELLNINAFDPKKSSLHWMPSSQKYKKLKENKTNTEGNISIVRDQVLPKKSNIMLSLQKNVMRQESQSNEQNLVFTISLSSKESLDMNKFNNWISNILQTKGKDIYRMKGILSFHGYDEKFVLHAVHMIFDGERGEEWNAKDKRTSKLVLIGEKLDKDELEKGFLSTQASSVSNN